MHLGMQGLDAAIHDLRKAGDVGDVAHWNAFGSDRLGSAAGGEYFNTVAVESVGECRQARLV